MKKIRLILIGLIFCALSVFPTLRVNAETQVSTYYPHGIEDYVDLNTLSSFDIVDNNILYSTSDNKVYIYNKDTKSNLLLNTDNAIIRDVSIAGDYIFILTETSAVKIFKIADLASNSPVSNVYYPSGCANLEVLHLGGKYYYLYVTNTPTSTLLNLDIYSDLTKDNHSSFSYQFDNSGTFHIAMNENYIVAKNVSGEKMYIFNQLNTESTDLTPITNSSDGNSYFEIMGMDSASTTKCIGIVDNNVFISTSASTNSIKIAKLTPSVTESNQGTFEYTQTNLIIDQIAVRDEKVYVFNGDNSDIIEYSFNSTNKVFVVTKSIIAGKGNEKGRFKDVTHVSYKSEQLYVADSGNSRIQILKSGEIYEVETNDYTCSEVVADKENNFYYVLTYNGNSFIYKNGILKETINGTKIISIDINLDGTLYMLSASRLYEYNGELKSVNLAAGMSIDETSRLRINVDYTDINVNNIQTLSSRALTSKVMVSYGETISVIDKLTGGISDSFTLGNNIKDFTFNFNNNLVVLDNEGNLIRCGFGDTSDKFATLTGFQNYSCFDVDIVTGDIYIYNNGTSAFDVLSDADFCPSGDFLSYYNDIDKRTGNSEIWKFGTIQINSLVYDHPNYCGNFTTIKSNNTNCIVLNYNEDFVYIGYVLNNTFKTGYIELSNLLGGVKNVGQDDTNYKVRTTINNVNIYKYPSIYKDNTLKTISQGTVVSTLGKYPISIDGNNYYIVELGNNQYGYIYAKDVVVNDNIVKSIKTNASITIFDGKSSVVVYVEADESSNILLTLSDGHKINVVDYDKNEKFCKINFVDQDGQEREGYVLTKYVKMAGLSTAVITAIILLVLDIAIATIVIIFFTVYRKKQKAEAEKEQNNKE